jgi:peptide/nickel transport system permease protein
MVRLIQTRLLSAVPSIIGVVIVTFLLTRALPGDPAVYFAGPAATPQAIAEIRHSLGLDRSLPEQFLVYVRDLAHGRLGNSLSTGQPVIQELLTRLPASIELTLLALFRSGSPCRSALLPPDGLTPGSTIFAVWYRPPG